MVSSNYEFGCQYIGFILSSDLPTWYVPYNFTFVGLFVNNSVGICHLVF